MYKIIDFYRIRADDNLLLFWIKEIVIALAIIGLFCGLALLLRYLLANVAPRFTAYTRTDLSDRLLKRITHQASLLVFFAGLYIAVHSLPLPDKAQLVTSGIIFVINVVILTNIAFRISNVLLSWYGARVMEKPGGGPDRQILPLIEKVIAIVLISVALIIALKHFDCDILSLVTALGIGSLAIGLAAKDTLANMISGFTLMIDRPFCIGDRIQLAGGQWGDVVDIGLRCTRIQTADNTLLIIPNSALCQSTVTNMALPDMKGKGRVNVAVSHGSDVSVVKGVLVDTALELPDVLRDPPPEAFFMTLGDSALNISLFFWVADYNKMFATTDRLNTLIITRFRNAGIKIPYPTRTVILEKEE
ncbi:MAG: mechanosensitive ion channel domain-containing protein [Deltaproteobacteria bacterium]